MDMRQGSSFSSFIGINQVGRLEIAMFRRVDAMRYVRPAHKGRNGTSIISCVDDDGQDLDAFVKFDLRCENGANALIREAFSAFFATDLGLPTPEPLLVEVSEEFIGTLQDDELRGQLQKGSRFGYGTVALPDGYNTFIPAKPLRVSDEQAAAEIVAFDAAAMNPDRRLGNSNLMDGPSGLAMIDHDLCFVIDPFVALMGAFPWKDGQMHNYCGPEKHILWQLLREKTIDLSFFQARAQALKVERFDEYAQCIPPEWRGNADVTEDIVSYLKQFHQNIEKFVGEVVRALK